MGQTQAAETFQEYVDSRGLTMSVDAKEGVVRGVKVLGFKSRNGRTYLPKAVAEAQSKYEGTRVNIDHPLTEGEPRSYADRFGSLRDVRLQKDGLYADLHYNPHHALASQFAYDAEHSPENVGLSHHVEAKARRTNGQMEVESITSVVSVDLVADPATTSSLFESKEHEMSELTIEVIKEQHSELYEEIRATITEDLKGQLAACEAKVAKHEKKEVVEGKLAEAKLPASLVTELFMEQCLLADDNLDALIADRSAIARQLESVDRPSSKEQGKVDENFTYSEGAAVDGKTFAASVCD